MSKYRAKKTTCSHGHTHASMKEAVRCNDLHLLQRAGHIAGLQQQPKFAFSIEGRQVKMANGHVAGITCDFSYVENGRKVVEEVKGFVVRDFPLRWAIAQALHPEIVWRLT